MNPTRVWAENFRTYEEVSWEIPSGLTAIVGHNTVTDGSDSNGSGKSSLLELLPIALFGPPMPWTEYLTAGGDAEACEVGCELEHSGERYRIRRTFSAKGRGSSKLDFERWGDDDSEAYDDHIWRPLTRGTQQDTQDAINATLHLSESVFSHSVYAAQGARHFADPSLPPRERKQIIAEALGLDAWDVLLEHVRTDMAETKSEILGIEARLGTFADEIESLPRLYEERSELVENARGVADLLQTAEATLADAVAGHAAYQESVLAHTHAAEVRDQAQQVVTRLTGELTAGRAAADEGKALAEKLPELRERAAQVDELAKAVAEYDSAQAHLASAQQERARKEALLVDLRERAKSLMEDEAQHTARSAALTSEAQKLGAEGTGICQHCLQRIGGEALAASIASIKRDRDALDARAVELRAEIERTMEEGKTLGALLAEEGALGPVGGEAPRQALADARAAERELLTAEERIRQLGLQVDRVTSETVPAHAAAVTALSAAEDILASTTPKPSAIDWVRTKDAAAMQVGLCKSGDHQAREALVKADEKIRNLEELRDRSQEAVLAKGLLEGRLDHLKQMEAAYGRNGIPALLMEALAIPRVEREASRVLELLGVPFRIELVTQAEKKSGGLKDTMDVVVHGPDGPLRFESYSGGEQTRLGFALRVAFARLIAGQRGSEIGVLFLDELQFLDSSGLAAVADVLRGLTEFRAICLVSHDERLVDAFDSVVTVVRDESGSRLEEAA